ncbi:MAG TPA: SgcJ/EcaC family oxidoreductase, partial [Pyrinomonadaceae bacterium]|nr:SgcJ/EcaC family oxidoreductase [Pyrinomonadaceae bacterium]
MKANFFLIFTALILFVYAASAQSLPIELILEQNVSPHKGLDDVYRRFSEAYRKLDAEAVTNLYTDDAFYLSPGSAVERGREKILANFSGFFNSVKSNGGSLTISFRILERGVSGDLAYDVGIYTLRQERAGKTQSDQGKFVVVARQVKKGDWRFHVDSYSDLPKAESGSATGAQDLEKLLDPIFAERMQRLNIPGAVVSVVKDGKIIFAKGYGFADIDKKTPVVADKTIFRIGSFSKVFTAFAVMQLAD